MYRSAAVSERANERPRADATGREAAHLGKDELIAAGRRVLEVESRAVAALAARLGDSFARACRLIAFGPKDDEQSPRTGRLIVSGIGKSGIVARKIAATFTSTGTPATFLHPVEGLHGDLGIVQRGDVALLVSKSGESAELTGLVEYLSRLGVPIVAMTGDSKSSLARQLARHTANDPAEHATVVLDASVDEEACPMDLVPTSSTTAALALGDALAVVVLQLKGFRAEDFALLHPGGALGRKLTVRVRDVMLSEGYPSLGEGARMRDTVVPIAEMRGTVPIVDAERRVVGVVTAGNLTRLMERDDGWPERSVRDVMSKSPRLAQPDELGSAAVYRMEEARVMALPVTDENGVLVGLVHLHDLMKAGAV
jgi:arabinose-5-phosphate isomerase